jgi:hypothetical protein
LLSLVLALGTIMLSRGRIRIMLRLISLRAQSLHGGARYHV